MERLRALTEHPDTASSSRRVHVSGDPLTGVAAERRSFVRQYMASEDASAFANASAAAVIKPVSHPKPDGLMVMPSDVDDKDLPSLLLSYRKYREQKALPTAVKPTDANAVNRTITGGSGGATAAQGRSFGSGAKGSASRPLMLPDRDCHTDPIAMLPTGRDQPPREVRPLLHHDAKGRLSRPPRTLTDQVSDPSWAPPLRQSAR